MLFLLAVPVIALVVLAHSLLRIYAPSNILAASVRRSRPMARTTVALAGLALLLISAAHGLSVAIDRGAPGWLHLVVLVLAWDAIKVGALAMLTAARSMGATARYRIRRSASPTQLAA
jgi:hypothetical protein